MLWSTQALGLPTDASGDDTRLMVEGKLGEMEKDPRTVQVCTDDPLPDGRATVIGLQDATGLFLKVEKELQRDMEDGERLMVRGWSITHLRMILNMCCRMKVCCRMDRHRRGKLNWRLS